MDVRPIGGKDNAAPNGQPAKAETYETRGVIQKITAAGVTLKHEPVPTLQWPGMTMMFRLEKPVLARGFKVGDRVRFTFSQEEAGPTIRSLSREAGK